MSYTLKTNKNQWKCKPPWDSMCESKRYIVLLKLLLKLIAINNKYIQNSVTVMDETSVE